MNLPYFPGCTLKADAKNFEESAMKVMEKLDLPLEEMDDWICCGTVFSMTSDDLMLQMASIRNLLRAEKQDIKELVVLCSMCYNTLKRAEKFITEDEENLQKINEVMYKEGKDFQGTVEVKHLLTILQENITFDKIKEQTEKPLANLKLGAYYGCLLLRPEEVGIDKLEDPSTIEDLLQAMGSQTIKFPYRLECCGAYQTVDRKDITIKRTYEIINSARKAGCEAIVTSCPLCAFNLDQRQKETAEEYMDFVHIPVFYFTELMSIALGTGWDENWKKLHYINPEPLLKEKGLI